MEINFDLATSLAITAVVVGIVFLARFVNGPADRFGPWLIWRKS